ncbi:hypothetical protein PF008_g12135 [Phytophthora fragariae]|uniref:Integrase catalytic domain-containing protein n=1 Tax=Phytophthora fragariae TaxID=53985 RepID=A0A6G0RPN8_9STRA|nr:hypothetical protein PF008_g12135 [Phytophthora fragariae]
MADAPGSGVRLTDMSRLGYLTCVQGQQSRVNQSRKDTGKNWPVDKIGGVICSNIKGPMSPRDRNGNRYLINFVDHSTNYVRAFMAKNKIEATKKVEHFPVFLEEVQLPRPRASHGRWRRVQERRGLLPGHGRSPAGGRGKQPGLDREGGADAPHDPEHGALHALCKRPAAQVLRPLRRVRGVSAQQEPVERQSETPVAGDVDGQAVGPDEYRDIRQPVHGLP